MGSFKLKLVLYFVLLSLLPIGAAVWGFESVAGQSETRRVDARLQEGLRSTLAAYQESLDAAQAAAAGLAASRPFQFALERRDTTALSRLLAAAPHVYVTASGGFRVGPRPALAARRQVAVLTPKGVAGVVVGYVPFDTALVRQLGATASLDRADTLVVLDGSRVVASAARVAGPVAISSGRIATVPVAGRRYRVLAVPALGGASSVRFALLSPQARIDAANASARDRLLLGLLGALGLVSLVAYLEGRSIVRTLRGLAQAAQGIARGRLGERVPVRGRDEFALLGTAFNDMAGQLEERLAELAAERARLRDAITRFGEALAATHDLEQLLHVIVQAAVEATGATGARLEAESGELVELGGLEGAERLELPLLAGSQRFGVLHLVGRSFDEEQRMTGASLASHAAVALENARLHRIVERQALVDGLTGVANRRQCEEALGAEIARAARLGTPLSLVLADLDHFKGINDEHGHAAGDAVLRGFADILRSRLRESDLAGRWGGEEFLVLLPGTNLAGALELAEQLRSAVEAASLTGPDGEPLPVTCSFGVAQHARGGSERELFLAADQALYEAKHAGRNRVEAAAPIRSF